MYTSETKLRVRYSETDKMGYCYYGNYAAYFEVARVEALRQLGINYKDLEDDGFMMPVHSFSIKYFKPAYYDEELRIETTIKELPTGRITFHYATFNESGTQINEAVTTLVFVSIETKKPCRIPEPLAAALQKHFD